MVIKTGWSTMAAALPLSGKIIASKEDEDGI